MTEQAWLNLFGDNLASIMLEKGITQSQLAKRSGVSKTCINQYLSKRRMPSVKSIVNLSYALHVTCDDLLDLDEEIL